MKKVNLLWLLPAVLLIGGLVIFFNTASKAESATATSIVISEVQIAGASASADFIELYNPTSLPVNLSSFNLVKRTSSGSTDTLIVNFGASDVIASHGFLLWCFNHISSNLGCDKHSADTISNNNTIALRDGALNTGTIIDALTIGVALHTLGEGAPPATPSAGQSVERKANSSSTIVSMDIAGIDEFLGNAEDTDDNSADFIVRTISQPQNSSSSVEPVAVPTPSEVPTPTLEPTVVPTEVPTPTIEPTSIPTPTTEPTAIPTVTVAPTAVPTITPIVSPVPSPLPFPRLFTVTCSTQIKTLNFRFFQIQISIPTCRLVRA
ncbi:MAG: lamin tail domain-containing protein [Patescibacteria group bacterium]